MDPGSSLDLHAQMINNPHREAVVQWIVCTDEEFVRPAGGVNDIGGLYRII
jgi:hypothetical protein